MPDDNVKLARETIEAWNRRDLDRLVEICAEDMEWIPANAGAMEGTVYRGRAEVLEGWRSTWETWAEFRFEEREVRDLGDSVLWLGAVHARGRGSELELEQELSNHISIRDGMIVRTHSHLSWREGLEAAGVADPP